MFADGYPLLVISAESLAGLNARLDEPLPMNRFRPTLVVEGLGPHGEDEVRLLRVGEAVIEMVKPCTRCVITTTDQRTAERGREPLRTLASYRTRDRGIQFGQNCVPRVLGTLRVGDPVEVVAARTP
nr:MOSC domain-containing protein [Actinomadura coerulea]